MKKSSKPKDLFKVSQSRVNTYRLCHRKYFFKYVEKIRAKLKKRPLKFGSIVHKLLQEHSKGHDPFKTLQKIAQTERKLFIEEREMYGNIVEDIRYIMRAYFSFWKDSDFHLIKPRGEKAISEIEFTIEVDDGIECTGIIDGLVSARRMNWLGEHKTHKNFPDANHRWRNMQSAIYLRVADMLGWQKLDGTLWNFVRSKPPTRPQLLNAGGLSQRKIDSLPEVIIDTIRKNNLSVSPYREFIADQTNNLPTWFDRVYTAAKPRVVKAIWEDFIDTAREMKDTYGKKKDRNIGQHCTWCEFEPLCRAELSGLDTDFLKEREYEANIKAAEDDNGEGDETST